MLSAVNINPCRGTVTGSHFRQAGKCSAQAGDIVVQVTVRGRFTMIVPDGGKIKSRLIKMPLFFTNSASRRLAIVVSVTGSRFSSANSSVELSSSKMIRLLIKNLIIALLDLLLVRIITEI